jgi:hypothetical protein
MENEKILISAFGFEKIGHSYDSYTSGGREEWQNKAVLELRPSGLRIISLETFGHEDRSELVFNSPSNKLVHQRSPPWEYEDRKNVLMYRNLTASEWEKNSLGDYRVFLGPPVSKSVCCFKIHIKEIDKVDLQKCGSNGEQGHIKIKKKGGFLKQLIIYRPLVELLFDDDQQHLFIQIADILRKNAGREHISAEDLGILSSSPIEGFDNVSRTSPSNIAATSGVCPSRSVDEAGPYKRYIRLNIFCTKCGAKNKTSNKFCIKCGSQLSFITDTTDQREVSKADYGNALQAESQVVIDTDGTVRIIVELPGVKKESIDLQVAENVVHVSAKNGKSFYKKINLDYAVDPNSAKASYVNGELTVCINKKLR